MASRRGPHVAMCIPKLHGDGNAEPSRALQELRGNQPARGWLKKNEEHICEHSIADIEQQILTLQEHEHLLTADVRTMAAIVH